MSFNNVIVSCIQNSLNEMDLSKYKDVNLYNEDNFNNNNDDDEKLKKLNIQKNHIF